MNDAFFKSMAVTNIGGLALVTTLTLIAAPLFSDVFFKRDEKGRRRLELVPGKGGTLKRV